LGFRAPFRATSGVSDLTVASGEWAPPHDRRRSSWVGSGLYPASRQYHAKRRSFVDLALHGDVAPHRDNDLPHDPQPQSQPTVPSLRHRALEPLKDDLLSVRGD